MARVVLIILLILTSAISSGCRPVDAVAKKTVYARFPGATVENAIVSVDKKFLCGEVQPKDAAAHLFYASMDGTLLAAVGPNEKDFRAFLSTCGVSEESREEMNLRIRWAQLDDMAQKGLRPQSRNEKSHAEYAFDLCSEAMLRDGHGIVKSADTCSRVSGK